MEKENKKRIIEQINKRTKSTLITSIISLLLSGIVLALTIIVFLFKRNLL